MASSLHLFATHIPFFLHLPMKCHYSSTNKSISTLLSLFCLSSQNIPNFFPNHSIAVVMFGCTSNILLWFASATILQLRHTCYLCAARPYSSFIQPAKACPFLWQWSICCCCDRMSHCCQATQVNDCYLYTAYAYVLFILVLIDATTTTTIMCLPLPLHSIPGNNTGDNVSSVISLVHTLLHVRN